MEKVSPSKLSPKEVINPASKRFRPKAAEELLRELRDVKEMSVAHDNSRNQVGVQNYKEEQEAQGSKI